MGDVDQQAAVHGSWKERDAYLFSAAGFEGGAPMIIIAWLGLAGGAAMIIIAWLVAEVRVSPVSVLTQLLARVGS
jgi:hypothetical protein